MIPIKIKDLMRKLLENGYEAYIIGGAVRDYYLGNTPHDYDIFTNATGEEILKIFPNGKVLGGEERQAKILTVIVDGVEISQYRANGDRTKTGKTLAEHQATCDFTVNSIAWDINGRIIDPNNGLSDIGKGVLKFVGNPDKRIKEDPLRILRGLRFWSKFKTFKNIISVLDNLDLLDTLPKERIREEFLKIIKDEQGIENLWCDEIIYKILPELEDVVGMIGGQFHNESVNNHMEFAFKESCKITDNILLRLACFLHDIGKGKTISFDENGHLTHFYQHETVGAEIVENWMNIMKFSKDEIKYVTALIRLHMYSYKDTPSKKSYVKFFNKLKDANIPIEDYIMLIYCDNQGNLAKPRIKFGDFIKGNWLHKKYYEIKYSEEPMTVKDLKIGGGDLIKRYGLEPGPEIGKILKDIYECILNGDIVNEKAEIFRNIEKYYELEVKNDK